MSSRRAWVFCPALLFSKLWGYNPGMKSPLVIGLSAIALLTACDEKPATPQAAPSAVAATPAAPTNAPGGYLGAVMKGQQTAVKVIDTTSIDKAIQLFSVENGRNPKDLNELVEQKFLPRIPETPFGTKLVYDSNAGTVKVVAQ
jgi:hypothetical protein